MRTLKPPRHVTMYYCTEYCTLFADGGFCQNVFADGGILSQNVTSINLILRKRELRR